MKHRVKGRKFSRVRKQRKALLKTLLGSLVLHEKIRTTEAKAKEMKSYADSIVNKAKNIQDEKKKVTSLRLLRDLIPVKAVEKFKGGFIQRFEGRKSGYTRIIRFAPRKSDGAKMAIIEFV